MIAQLVRAFGPHIGTIFVDIGYEHMVKMKIVARNEHGVSYICTLMRSI